jgi:hypothetical protein
MVRKHKHKPTPAPRKPQTLSREEVVYIFPHRVWSVLRRNLCFDVPRVLQVCTQLHQTLQESGIVTHPTQKVKSAQILANKVCSQILGPKSCFMISGRSGKVPPALDDDVDHERVYDKGVAKILGRPLSRLLMNKIADTEKQYYMAAYMDHAYHSLVFDAAKKTIDFSDLEFLLRYDDDAIEFFKTNDCYDDWCQVMNLHQKVSMKCVEHQRTIL